MSRWSGFRAGLVPAVAVALLFFAVVAVAALRPDVAAASQTPVAAYSFDEGEGEVAGDLFGENDGALEGAEWFEKGKYGSALLFDGPETCVTVPHHADLQLSEEMTLEAWVKPHYLSDQPVIYKSAWGNLGYAMGVSLYEHAKFEGLIGEGVGKFENVVSPDPIEEDVWSHLAFTYDGATMRLYVNGELVATQAQSTPPPAGEGPLAIGCNPLYPEDFDGLIDEVRIYDRALPAAEVNADAARELQTPSRSPVAAYSFDEGEGEVTEDVAGEHDGELNTVDWVGGKFGQALYFDGAGDYVEIADSPDLQLGEEFTLEAWVRPDAVEDEGAVISKTAGSFFSYQLFAGSREFAGIPEGFLGYEPWAWDDVEDENPLEAKTWNHLAVTYDGSRQRLYVNGELVDTSYEPTPPAMASVGPLYLGGNEDEEDFKGRIDEVRIYDRALGAGEIGADRGAPLETPSRGPVAAYSFDAGEGEVAEDLVGEYDGAIEGAEWFGRGRYGSALTFDGENDCVTVADATDLELSEELTVEAWVKPRTDSDLPIVYKDSWGNAAYALGIGLYSTGNPEGLIGEGVEEVETVAGPENVEENVWTHLAFTYDGAKMRIYVDGALAETQPQSTGPPTGEGALSIGCNHLYPENFEGLIDEIRIYDRALDEGEIAADKGAPIQTSSPGPVAAYSFDAGEGEVAEDLVGEHDGELVSTEWVKGKYGSALHFDGFNDYVEIPDSPELQLTEEFTLEAWVRPEKVETHAVAISKEAGSFYSYKLYVGSREEAGVPEGFLGYEPWAWEDVEDENPLEPKTWNHLALTYDGANLRLYVNGELVDTESSPPAQASVGPLMLGGNDDEEFFIGRIDEVRIYDRALEVGEIEPNQGPDALAPGITLSGPLTEGLKEGTSEYDLNIQAVDGTVDRRGSGVKTVTVTVDGEVADSVTQNCPETNCGLQYKWTFDQEKYGFEPHTVLVSAEDHAGNVSSKPLQLAVPNGSFPACSTNGTPVESEPDEVEGLAGGGSNAIFHGADGEKVEYRSAPSGFDPKKASDGELDLYGYPPRPPVTESALRKSWEETVGESTGSAEPGGCMGVSDPDFAAASGSGGPTVRYSDGFAGWLTEDLEGPANQWRGALATYRVPRLRSTCPPQTAAHVAWVGVGGSGVSTPFFQAGTNQPYGISKNSDIAAFTEFFRGGPEKGTKKSEQPVFHNLNLQPGDAVFVVAMWKPGPEKAFMYVQNLSTGKKISAEPHGKESVFYDGRRLHYITAERPRLGNGRFQQQDFGTFGFQGVGSFVSGKNWQVLGAQSNRVKLEMQRWKNNRPVDQLMVSTSRISSNGAGFQAKWHHCHP